jgi:sarcosine oxidase, subunit delta
MLRIHCPHCGLRDEPEFSFGGPAHVARPDVTADNLAWSQYLYARDNPKGVHFERWCHSFGCGRWFNVARDTVSHEILAVYAMGDPRPGVGSKPAAG